MAKFLSWDRLKEYDGLIKTYVGNLYNELIGKINGKANSSHTHSISNVENLESSLASKSDSNHVHNYAGSTSNGGSANSALKLATARAINGINFDGTAPITITANPTETALTGVDLNDYKSPGFYYGGGNNGCTNVPSGIDTFGMVVFKNAGGYTCQLLVGGNNKQNIMYVRTYTSSAWSAWVTQYSDVNKPTPAAIGASASGHNHDDRYYTESEINTKVSNLQSDIDGKVDKVSGKGLSSSDYTAAEKTKLAGIAEGAQKNTITGVKGNSESSYRTGNVNITKANIGLGNVDNTTDVNKPLSTAQKAYIDDSLEIAKEYTDEKIGNLIDGAPTTLDTLKEIADAMATNDTVVDALESAIGNKTDKAFSNVLVGSTTIAADGKADTLTLASGGNITITPDATNDKVTFTVADGTTGAKGVVKLSSTVADNETLAATPKAVKSAYDLANTAKTTADSKQAAITGAATTITGSNLTASRALVSDANGKVAVSAVTSTELGYLDGVTSAIQTQLNGKASTSHGTHVTYGTSASALGTSSAGTATTVSRSDHVHALPALTSCTGTLTVAKGGTGATTAAGALTNLGLTATAAELNYMDGVTSNVQTQLNSITSSRNMKTYHELSQINCSTYAFSDVLNAMPDYSKFVNAVEAGFGTANSLSSTYGVVEITRVNQWRMSIEVTDSNGTQYVWTGNKNDLSNITLQSVGGSATIDKANKDSDGYIINRSYVSLRARNEIPANADLNTANYIKVGTYYCANNANTTTLKNCPTAIAFMMHVYAPINTSIDDETTQPYRYRIRKIINISGEEWVSKVSVDGTAGQLTYGGWSRIITSAGNIETSNGYLKSTLNGNTVTIGSQNATCCHFQNSANIPFHFNKAIHAQDGFTVYNTTTSLTSNRLVVGKSSFHSDHIELYGNSYPFIDFHYNNSTSMTSRIIEEASGTLRINGMAVTTTRAAIYNNSKKVVQFNLNNTLQNGSLYLSENGNFGLYSVTYGNWLIRGDTNGVTYLQMPTAFFGDSSTETQYFAPKKSGMAVLGTPSYKWNILYAMNGTIQTSDRNAKEDFRTFDSNENYEKFFMDLKPMVYKFKEGTSGRDHFGFVSQDVEESLYKYGFDDLSFGGFCRDVKTEEVENEDGKIEEVPVIDENGNEQYNYSLRYDEFVSLNTYMIQKHEHRIRKLVKENQEMKAQITELKEENQEMKAKNEELEARLLAVETLLEKNNIAV